LRSTHSALSVEEAADQAIQAWLAAASGTSTGFHWKQLFLPEGSRLRIPSHPEHPEACVIGNELFCQGHPVSPNRYVLACAGGHRNAWELVSILLPGEKYWKLAALLRRPPPPPRPVEPEPFVAPLPPMRQHRWGERRAWNVGGRRETDSMPEPVFLDH
jgi:hypothetical protein